MDLDFESIKLTIILISGFGVVSVAANKIAVFFQKIHLPIITGFLMTGILCGPFVLDLIPSASISRLNFINELALAFIAFAAGAELYFRELISKINSIKWNTLGQLFFSFGLGSIIVFFLADHISFMQEMNFNTRLAVSLMSGTVFVARSPASAIAVINELRAKGPFTQTVMGVTVLKDFVVIILFALCFALSISLVSGNEFKYISVVLPVLEISISAGIGYLLGRLLNLVLALRIMSEAKAFLIVTLGYSVYFANHLMQDINLIPDHHIRLEPLITCIIASLYITNYSKYKPEFLSILDQTGPMIYAAFFTLTGASLNIHVLFGIWPVALFFFGIRLLTIIGGSYAGGMMAKDPMRFVNVGWMPYVTQAGVALGLTALVSNQFPEWGTEFATIMIGCIVLNQIVGPPLFKFALRKIGEDRTRAKFQTDGIRDAIIFGFESQSVALAKQLMSSNWKVQMVTMMDKDSIVEPEGIAIHYMKELDLEKIQGMGAAKTEAIVCMLSDRENLQICELFYHHFGTPDIIVRLNERVHYDKFLSLGARVVDPSMAMVSLMDHYVRSPQATSLLLGMEPGQDSRDLEVLNPDLHGVTLRDLRLPADVIILSIKRSGQMIISHGYTRLRLKDLVTFVGSRKSLDDLTRRFDY
ncbi:MAG: cation:proton antiporter [Reichenbachiella sp.]|uniref:cation:proton antiporter domain-containing protein n=1 Tax=Reichenbachiella sp. TaxID=2184521 RepID=UPI003267D4E3